MYVDANLMVAGSISGNTVTPQAMFASGAAVVSTNSIDLTTARDIGEGQDIFARVQIAAAFTGGTSVQFQAIIADDAALTTNVEVVGSGPVVAVASAIAGYREVIKVNPKVGSLGRRYLGIQAVNVGANAAGTAVGDFGIGMQDNKSYASGFAVL